MVRYLVSLRGDVVRFPPRPCVEPQVRALQDVDAAAEIADLWPSRKVMEATMGLTPLKVSNA